MRQSTVGSKARVQLAKALDALHAIPSIGKEDAEIDSAYQELWATAIRIGFVVTVKAGKHLVTPRQAR